MEFGFAGQEVLLKQLKEQLIKDIGISNNKVLKRKNRESAYTLMFSKMKDIENFYNYIYTNSQFYLSRKKEKFEEFLFTYNGTEVSD